MNQELCEHHDLHNRDTYRYPDGTVAGLLCGDCATKAGFCPICGSFIGGIDNEIPTIHEHGMCSECVDWFENETRAYQEDEDFDYL